MEYHRRYPLKDLNSFRTEAYAKIFCSPTNIDEIRKCLVDYPDEKKLIIGGGCNLFFTKDFDGLVIKLALYGMHDSSYEEEPDDEVYIEAMASEDWDSFVNYTIESGLCGLENLSLIPGTVGAAPVQNIGAYGAEVKDSIREVVALDMHTGEVVSFTNAECEFAYRDSVFKRKGNYIIISVVFCLQRTFHYQPKYLDLNKELEDVESPTAKDVRDAVIRIRRRKLPDERELPNAGSFFKNPYITVEHAEEIKEAYPELPVFPYKEGWVKTSAAFLIDRAGYKGKRVGDVGTYPNQPLIIVNYGTEDGNEIVGFMNEVRSVVKEQFDIMLDPEVHIF
ncbi:UDP-N-acetylmuramate dehydrogenase [Dysgonomonas sp. 25]|uniref:UDP-N-acetylmuramate dehydrogenase n=1 Tax=Dysgonomonas sp. 25 TaxID=2302933 RepID=UPI0013D755E4|nr:UDP-N-acetylmuramate dehydrogenase [Dysgonomonas sp. 25]NDV68416.1 UDP-N-acetylmuramate dehydrogenase [Dysgonomonas sp. 25]